MAELLYQGHASFRLRAWDGTTVYLDPYAGEGYDLPADGVLVTHEHYDHNEVGKVSLKPGARVLRSADFLAGGEYGKAQIGPLEVQAVPAYNKNHDKNACVGFVIRLEGRSLYFAGDTSRTDYMEEMGALGLDWGYSQRTVTRLTEEGFLTRTRQGRAWCLDLTPKGQEAFGLSHQVFWDWDAGALAGLTEAERNQLFTLLAKIQIERQAHRHVRSSVQPL